MISSSLLTFSSSSVRFCRKEFISANVKALALTCPMNKKQHRLKCSHMYFVAVLKYMQTKAPTQYVGTKRRNLNYIHLLLVLCNYTYIFKPVARSRLSASWLEQVSARQQVPHLRACAVRHLTRPLRVPSFAPPQNLRARTKVWDQMGFRSLEDHRAIRSRP